MNAKCEETFPTNRKFRSAMPLQVEAKKISIHESRYKLSVPPHGYYWVVSHTLRNSKETSASLSMDMPIRIAVFVFVSLRVRRELRPSEVDWRELVDQINKSSNDHDQAKWLVRESYV
jgi:hypothetical protein